MAQKTYLYHADRLTDADLVPNLPPGAEVTVGAVSQVPRVAVTIDDADKDDLDPAMESLGWTYVAELTGNESAERTDHGVLDSDPPDSVSVGDTYFNSVTNRVRRYDGTAWRGEPSSNLLIAFPGFNTDVVVPDYVKTRQVFGTIELSAALAAIARVELHVKVGGSYSGTPVQKAELAAGLTSTEKIPYAVTLIGGDTYKWTKTANAGTTEVVEAYSFVDQT